MAADRTSTITRSTVAAVTFRGPEDSRRVISPQRVAVSWERRIAGEALGTWRGWGGAGWCNHSVWARRASSWSHMKVEWRVIAAFAKASARWLEARGT